MKFGTLAGVICSVYAAAEKVKVISAADRENLSSWMITVGLDNFKN